MGCESESPKDGKSESRKVRKWESQEDASRNIWESMSKKSGVRNKDGLIAMFSGVALITYNL